MKKVCKFFTMREDSLWKEPYFSHGPEFGLGCDVVECTILIVK